MYLTCLRTKKDYIAHQLYSYLCYTQKMIVDFVFQVWNKPVFLPIDRMLRL